MGKYSNFTAKHLDIGQGCQIDETVRIAPAQSIEIAGNTKIGAGVQIEAKHLKIGTGCEIDQGVEIIKSEKTEIGDHSYIGPGVRIIGGRFSVGEYSKIHNHCYIYSKKHVLLGHQAWMGQGTTLDGTGGISCGNFLGAGINSALYSHIRHGDVFEGCMYDQDKELIIGDDVWFVGMCLVSPVRASSKSLALLGSVIVRDMAFNHCYGGNPAVDLTDKLGAPWREVSISEKISKMNKYLETYSREVDPSFDIDQIVVVEDFPEKLDDRVYYNVTRREYTKYNGDQEVRFNKWLFPYRAKFVPRTLRAEAS